MTISYNWLSEYLPEKMEPEKLSKILTSIGLEVESMEPYESLKGGLKGLVIGEVKTVEKHPDADKLSVTTVDTGETELLQIVCGAPNVAVGQKVVVAPVGTTIFPSSGDSITMKKAKIRGIESFGMICAADEIGLSNDHAGILVLPANTKTGIAAAAHFQPYSDIIFEIGLTPNRMDAMSHLGVAKDVCAYLSHHTKKDTAIKSPFKNSFRSDNQRLPINVIVENREACPRYSGVSIQGVTIGQSPEWLQQKLQAIGLRPINNIVDITNFILHETGQPLHAFDADKISGGKVVVRNLPEGTVFQTLDEKERKLFAEDLMICDSEKGMCIAGVYGGLSSGVTSVTKNIFLESAWFNPSVIRKTSVKHGLRTDAAARFEKGVDISNTVNVLKRAALLIKEFAGGEIASEVIDIYPNPNAKNEVTLKYHYLKKLSGKNYHGDTIKQILTALGFEVLKEGLDDIRVSVPYSKPDITIAADIVEEIMRIDGLDNIDIPPTISISPAVETLARSAAYKEKAASYLAAQGFNEIFTNSITNAAYYTEAELALTVKMINSLSADLNVMRPAMMETGLESVAYNLNRRNSDLRLFEFGKTYATTETGKYSEQQHLSIYITGSKSGDGWNAKAEKADFYYAKGLCDRLISLLGLKASRYSASENSKLENSVTAFVNNEPVATLGNVTKKTLAKFDIKQNVFFIDIDWDKVMALSEKKSIQFTGIPKFPAATRDLSIVVAKNLHYDEVEKITQKSRLEKLKAVKLFDVFESDKLGKEKKALAINFTFQDEEKTLTDKDIDSMMEKISSLYEKELGAEIRK
ncbi:MAG: phenylalanine--tRNA ligase subunit beta [Bacteroidota bacterium]